MECIDKEGEVFAKYNGWKQPKKDDIPMEELWCLDYTIAEFIYPRLVKFKKYHCGAASGHEYKNGHKRYSEKYGPKGDKRL